MEREGQLTPPELEVERRATAAVRENAVRLAQLYREKFGTEISTDNAREIVSPEYAESREARTRWSRATQKPAGALSDYLFDEALRNPNPDRARAVVMTAGGTGAGKTTSLANNPIARDAQFVYDSNLGSKRSSIEKIESARAAGNRVWIIFVHRDPIEALITGVLPRAMTDGRVVNLDAHGRMYRDSAENFRYLVRKYATASDVVFQAIDNTRLREGARPLPIENVANLRYSTKDLLPRLLVALENEYAARRISEAVYRETLVASPTPAHAGVSGDSGPGPSGPGG